MTRGPAVSLLLVFVSLAGGGCDSAPAEPPPAPEPEAPPAPPPPAEPVVVPNAHCVRAAQHTCDQRRVGADEVATLQFQEGCQADYGSGPGAFARGPCSPEGVVGGCHQLTFAGLTIFYDGADLANARFRCEEYSGAINGPAGRWLSPPEARDEILAM